MYLDLDIKLVTLKICLNEKENTLCKILFHVSKLNKLKSNRNEIYIYIYDKIKLHDCLAKNIFNVIIQM